ncbi:MAG: DUF1573 domain-containing protein [Opitutae bacterium]|nr:DUF1573 domain-containing protein [Opitutae bacterium]
MRFTTVSSFRRGIVWKCGRFLWQSLIVVLIGLPGVGRALHWTATEVELAIKDEGKTEAVVPFSFKNTRDKPVTITGFVSTCECTKPKLAKTTFAPGEGAQFDITVRYGNRSGLYTQYVTVATDEADAPPQKLTIRLTIPGGGLEIRPQFVFWLRGEPAEPKVITIRGNGRFVPNLTFSMADDDFTGVLRQPDPKDNRLFEIIIRPRRTDKLASVVARLDDGPVELPYARYTINALVK